MKLKKVKVLKSLEDGCLLRASRSGKVMAECGSTARVWDTRTWKVISEIDELDEDEWMAVCDLSPDGKLLAAGQALRSTRVFDTRTGRRVAQLSEPVRRQRNSAELLKFSPDGSALACVKSSKLQVFRTGDWESPLNYPLHPPKIADLAWTADGKSVVTASGKKVIFWSSRDTKKKMQLTGHQKLVQSVAIASDGTFMATASEDKTVMLWKLPSGKKYAEYTGHATLVFRVLLTPDGKTAASWDYKNEVHLWDTRTLKLLGKAEAEEGEEMAFSPDGRVLVLPYILGPLQVVDARNGKLVARMKEGNSVAFVGGRMAVSQGAKIVLWEWGK